MTPPIPDWIRSYRCPKGRFRNIYEYAPEESRLYGTESMFGDWDGELLLLGQDFCCTDDVEQWINQGRERVFAHNPTMITNRSLELHTRGFGCGMLYGSALAGMLKIGGSNSGLPGWSHMRGHLSEVLRFTIEHMSNLSAIACMGSAAWDLCHHADEREHIPLSHALKYRCPSRFDGLPVYAMPHPARARSVLGSKERVQERWDWMRTDLLGSSSHNAAA
ncbi:MAG: hypothetical protein ACF8K1_10715 [Phycisphaerales bacterium JB047]